MHLKKTNNFTSSISSNMPTSILEVLDLQDVQVNVLSIDNACYT